MNYLVIVIVGKLRLKTVPDEDTCLESPGTCDVAHSISTATKDQCWQVEALDKVDTVGVSAHTQVEATQAITGQTVTTTLQDHSLGPIPLHHALDNGLENALVGDIVDTVAEREVDGVVFARTDTDVAKFASTGEILAIFVERDSHDTIRRVESFLHTVTMVNININVEDPLLESQKFEDAKDDV